MILTTRIHDNKKNWFNKMHDRKNRIIIPFLKLQWPFEGIFVLYLMMACLTLNALGISGVLFLFVSFFGFDPSF